MNSSPAPQLQLVRCTPEFYRSLPCVVYFRVYNGGLFGNVKQRFEENGRRGRKRPAWSRHRFRFRCVTGGLRPQLSHWNPLRSIGKTVKAAARSGTEGGDPEGFRNQRRCWWFVRLLSEFGPKGAEVGILCHKRLPNVSYPYIL